ncbi:hypothetical protein CPB83DRAFT_849605 [Crepidotus variabilis]|uniref:Uncharacterized protein n=1 Tax=Crepidotus variabilis TaxID=179855 RepID=A0A9P6EMC5_9AGAR|nr:hypothetical protein CPB83DRAFT_849605 [Crepidotus variabilis]
MYNLARRYIFVICKSTLSGNLDIYFRLFSFSTSTVINFVVHVYFIRCCISPASIRIYSCHSVTWTQ